MTYTQEEQEFVDSLQGLGTREFIEALREYVAEPVLPSKGAGGNGWKTDMNTYKVIELTRKHVNNGAAMQSSAQLCLKDAEALQVQGSEVEAIFRAVQSLEYSVGVFHPDCQAADLCLAMCGHYG